LSKALEFLVTHKTTRSGDDSNSCENTAATCRQEIDQHDEFLGLLIKNCRKTLSHLESLVDKYSELTSDCEEPGSIGRKKWRTEMKDNWKRIRWTIEGGNLDELRGNLAVHINSLNLAVSAINKRVPRNSLPGSVANQPFFGSSQFPNNKNRGASGCHPQHVEGSVRMVH
jgi:hypothetical protein